MLQQEVIRIYIYKITNIVNGKVYIGQTIRPVKDRFHRHICDAINHTIDTHLTRAINKYGKENFVWEIIDTAESREELTQKEEYWIRFYDACHKGYNTARGGHACGGDTYSNLDNLDEIRHKLSVSKKGGKNPNSRRVKMFDLIQHTEQVFPSMQEAADFLKLSSHMPVSRRCRRYTKAPLENRYLFEYCDNEGVTTMESVSQDTVSTVA